MNRLEKNIKQLMQDVATIKTEVHQVKIDVAVVKEQQKHNREMNEHEHQEMLARINILEVTEKEHQVLIDKVEGANKIISIIARAGWGLLIAAISGLGVYLLM